MIPRNISKSDILRAMKKIDTEGIPKGRKSSKYSISYMGVLYPPKLVISYANLFANYEELAPANFSGGKEVNGFLSHLGFRIIGPEIDEFDEVTSCNDINISCITIQSYDSASNEIRFKALFDIVSQVGTNSDVILLPAGFFNTTKKANFLYKDIEYKVSKQLKNLDLDTIVCLGIDGRNNKEKLSKDQIALAINKKGIISIARKFYPTNEEADYIEKANHYLSLESDYSRIIHVKDKKLYLAICYDGFGIRKQCLENPNVDGILNLVHGFYPHGLAGSGEVYFAKYSFAGSSRQWNCPTFGASIFFDRIIPDKFPTGVLWTQGDKSVQQWKYSDNGMKTSKMVSLSIGEERAVVNTYSI